MKNPVYCEAYLAILVISIIMFKPGQGESVYCSMHVRENTRTHTHIQVVFHLMQKKSM